jgi:1-deoxy-D-xylulose-5-phosphate reductoisomerase
MMNKALEIIEAHWLFGFGPEQISVVIHPQSMVHSMVEYVDGSVLAQVSPPDMRLPIQYALTYPERCEGPARRLDLTKPGRWDFEPPSAERFPALELGYEVIRRGGTAGSALNAANEVAVARFLRREIRFTDIVRICAEVLEQHPYDSKPTIESLWEVDRWARQEAGAWTRSVFSR